MANLRLTAEEARRVAVRAQLLDGRRPADLLTVVQQLTLLQLDPTAAVAPNADLVAYTRLGAGYQPADLTAAIDARILFEHNALVRPMTDVGLYLASGREWPQWAHTREWIEVNDPFRRDVLARLREAGPLLSRDIADTAVRPWASTGWTNDRNVTQMLECLTMRGEVAVSGRHGRQRFWDLAERVYPADVVVPTAAEAERTKDQRRLQALGIARSTGTVMPLESYLVGTAGEPAVVDGVAGQWRVHLPTLDAVRTEGFAGRTALLSPFDRLAHDRKRAVELFDFEYTLEMYKPAAQRRWGYFALPILHGDRLVGKLDAKADRKAGRFTVHAVHEDGRWTTRVRRAVDAEIQALAGWLALEIDRSDHTDHTDHGSG